jgi:hypothetical protein
MQQQLSMKLKKDTSGDLSFPLSRPAHPSHYKEVRDGKGENTPPFFVRIAHIISVLRKTT